MATIDDSPVWVDGTLSAGNIRAGVASLTQGSGGVTSILVTGVDLAGSGPLFVQATGHGDDPACRTLDEGLQNVSVVSMDRTDNFTVYVCRSNAGTTHVFYFVTRNP